MSRQVCFPVQRGKHIEAAREMAEEYRKSLKEAKLALNDRDAENYLLFRQHMTTFLNMSFVDADYEVSKVKDHLTFWERNTPFGILEITGWRDQ